MWRRLPLVRQLRLMLRLMRCRLSVAAKLLPGTGRHGKSQDIQITNSSEIALDNEKLVERQFRINGLAFRPENRHRKQQQYSAREQGRGLIERRKQSTEICLILDMGSPVARPLCILGVCLARGRGCMFTPRLGVIRWQGRWWLCFTTPLSRL